MFLFFFVREEFFTENRSRAGFEIARPFIGESHVMKPALKSLAGSKFSLYLIVHFFLYTSLLNCKCIFSTKKKMP